MILEVAILDVKSNQEVRFEKDFKTASKYVSMIDGYLKHSLHRRVEKPNRYILHVEWETLEAHTIGFRLSKEYLEWKRLLHHYYDPFPVVEHYGENLIK